MMDDLINKRIYAESLTLFITYVTGCLFSHGHSCHASLIYKDLWIEDEFSLPMKDLRSCARITIEEMFLALHA